MMLVCVTVVGLPLLTVTVTPWVPPLQMVVAAGVLEEMSVSPGSLRGQKEDLHCRGGSSQDYDLC